MGTRTLAEAFGSRTAVAALLLVLLPASAMADRHKASFGGGGTYLGRSELWGIRMTGDWTLKEGPAPDDHLAHTSWTFSVAGELGQAAGVHDDTSFSQTTFLVGPRFTLNNIGSSWRFEPFAEVLVGAAYERALDARTSAAGAFGLGLDVPIGDLKSTEHHPLVVLRAQYGRHWINGDSTDWYDQWSASVVFRLTRKK
jgi:hypothetical protein